MNALDVLKYGHATLSAAAEAVPAGDRLTPGACGRWSPKDVMAHMLAYELMLSAVLAPFGGTAPPAQEGESSEDRLNDGAVARYADESWDTVLELYNAAHAKVVEQAAALGPAVLAQVGTIPWYGPEYSLDDFIVYAFYGHKREHSAQLAAFCDRHASRAHLYGTVFRMQPSPGKAQELIDLEARWLDERQPQIAGYLNQYMLVPDAQSGEVLGIVIFDSEQNYRANAEAPEQNRWYEQMRALLSTDPEWHDGRIVTLRS